MTIRAKMINLFAIMLAAFLPLCCAGQEDIVLSGKIVSQHPDQPVRDAHIDILDHNKRILQSLQSGPGGYFTSDSLPSGWLFINIRKDSFQDSRFYLDASAHDPGQIFKMIIELRRRVYKPFRPMLSVPVAAASIQPRSIHQKTARPLKQPAEAGAGSYAILLKVTRTPVRVDHPLHTLYAPIDVICIGEKWHYSTGQFTSVAQAQAYLERYIRPQHPTAVVWRRPGNDGSADTSFD